MGPLLLQLLARPGDHGSRVFIGREFCPADLDRHLDRPIDVLHGKIVYSRMPVTRPERLGFVIGWSGRERRIRRRRSWRRRPPSRTTRNPLGNLAVSSRAASSPNSALNGPAIPPPKRPGRSSALCPSRASPINAVRWAPENRHVAVVWVPRVRTVFVVSMGRECADDLLPAPRRQRGNTQAIVAGAMIEHQAGSGADRLFTGEAARSLLQSRIGKLKSLGWLRTSLQNPGHPRRGCFRLPP